MPKRILCVVIAAALLATAASAAGGLRCDAVVDGILLENAVWLSSRGTMLSVEAFCRASGAELRAEAAGYRLSKDQKSLLLPGERQSVYSGGQANGSPAFRSGASRFVSVEQLADTFGYHSQFDSEARRLYLNTPQATVPSGVRLPILMYHAVSNNPWSGNTGLFVRPSELEAQVKWLLEHGYDPITFEDLTSLDQYDKPILLTFDDGYDDNYTEALPILQKYGVKATFFVVPWHFDSPHCMDEEMLREAAATGLISIQSHTLTHPDLRELSEEDLRYQFTQANALIEEITGKQPIALAYPTGYNNKLVRTVAAEYYAYAVLMGGEAPVTGKTDPMRWHRIYVYRGMSISDFSYKVRNQ